MLAGLIFAIACTVQSHASDVVLALNDTTFENVTHAMAGDLPGAWFVKFYAPWCGHCTDLAPIWEDVATEVTDTEVKLADVDASSRTATGLAKRFKIRGFPTLVMFRDAFMYPYFGQRNKKEITDFIRGGWRNTKAEQVPSTQVDILKAVEWIQHDVSKERNWWRVAAAICAFFGICAGLTIGVNCCAEPPRRPREGRERQLEIQRRERAMREAGIRKVEAAKQEDAVKEEDAARISTTNENELHED